MRTCCWRNGISRLRTWRAQRAWPGGPWRGLFPAAHKARIFRPQGWISPVLLVDGHVEGVWRHERKNGRLEVLIERFARQPPRVRAGAAEEAERLAVFLGARLDKMAWR